MGLCVPPNLDTILGARTVNCVGVREKREWQTRLHGDDKLEAGQTTCREEEGNGGCSPSAILSISYLDWLLLLPLSGAHVRTYLRALSSPSHSATASVDATFSSAFHQACAHHLLYIYARERAVLLLPFESAVNICANLEEKRTRAGYILYLCRAAAQLYRKGGRRDGQTARAHRSTQTPSESCLRCARACRYSVCLTLSRQRWSRTHAVKHSHSAA